MLSASTGRRWSWIWFPDFTADPVKLLEEGGADVVIGSEHKRRRGIIHHPLFSFEILAVLAPEHPLRTKRILNATDFAAETLITYPVPEDRIDLILNVLKPAGIQPQRRTAEFTVAILQLVASRRGVAALPSWGIKSYVDHDYVIARRIGAHGLWSDLMRPRLRKPLPAPICGFSGNREEYLFRYAGWNCAGGLNECRSAQNGKTGRKVCNGYKSTGEHTSCCLLTSAIRELMQGNDGPVFAGQVGTIILIHAIEKTPKRITCPDSCCHYLSLFLPSVSKAFNQGPFSL